MFNEDWDGFARVFGETVRPDDKRIKSGRRLLVFSLVVLLALCLAAFVDGVFGAKDKSPTSAFLQPGGAGLPSPQVAVTPGAAWTSVAGPTCGGDAASSYSEQGHRTHGATTPTGWSSSHTGGYKGDGCTGGFATLPVSGKSDAFDADRYALWTFDLHTTFTRASCRLSTYVPKESAHAKVDKSPAYYYYYGAKDAVATKTAPLGGYTVKQTSGQGKWVDSPKFRITTGQVAVELVDAGSGSDATRAAAQISLSCSAA
jgi:hypothetical protein